MKKYIIALSSVLLFSFSTTKDDGSLTGSYVDERGNKLKVTEIEGGEKIKFEIEGVLDATCQGNSIDGTAEIFRVNKNGVADNYAGPMEWFTFTGIEDCNIEFEPNYKTKIIKVKETNCSAYKGAGGCGDWTGTYKKTK